ncbi:MAG: O-antigen ligase family protein [Pyrinomonadaceae bacterium]
MKIAYENIFSGLMMLLVFSLAFIFPFLFIFEQRIPVTDFIFLFVFIFWSIGILLKKIEIKFHFFFVILAFYLLSIFISVIFSANPKSSFIKFSGEIYLVFLTVITFNFINTLEDAKKLTLAWLSGTMFVLLIGFATILLFYFDPKNSLLNIFLNHYGTVPVGNYPRIKATFFHSNMLCNYLSVSLFLTLTAWQSGWINALFSKFLIGFILLISLFTFSPGLGGIALSLGVFFWLFYKSNEKNLLSKASLFCGIFVSIVFLGLLIFAMQKHPTAPYEIKIPVIEKEIYPSSRVMVWSATMDTFKNNFWTGIGLGEDVCRVRYLNPSGVLEDLRDGHNTVLNVSAQTGILGLISILAIIFYLMKKILKFKNMYSKSGFFYNCGGIAILSAFIYQGLGGSFEETRHIWVLFGMFLSAEKLTEIEI